MEKLRLLIPGLSCAACVSEIETALRAQEGVIWAEVSFASKEVAVVYDPIAIDAAGLVRSLGRFGLAPVVAGAQRTLQESESGGLLRRRSTRTRDHAAIPNYRR